MQETRLGRIERELGNLTSKSLGSWRKTSYGLLALLFGFFLGSYLTVIFLEGSGSRPLVSLIMLLIIEILVRLRTKFVRKPWPIIWVGVDNIRIGAVYALVLEAFKLGS